MDTCAAAYDSHAWAWRGRQMMCGRCGLVDLDAARMVEHVLTGLAAAGVQVVRTSRRG